MTPRVYLIYLFLLILFLLALSQLLIPQISMVVAHHESKVLDFGKSDYILCSLEVEDFKLFFFVFERKT
jgi:hypothetical protein